MKAARKVLGTKRDRMTACSFPKTCSGDGHSSTWLLHTMKSIPISAPGTPISMGERMRPAIYSRATCCGELWRFVRLGEEYYGVLWFMERQPSCLVRRYRRRSIRGHRTRSE